MTCQPASVLRRKQRLPLGSGQVGNDGLRVGFDAGNVGACPDNSTRRRRCANRKRRRLATCAGKETPGRNKPKMAVIVVSPKHQTIQPATVRCGCFPDEGGGGSATR